MTRPIARVLALLEILQSGGTRTVAELAERLDVDERTVRRYVDRLLELDIPVRSVRGRYGGYRLAPGYRMPPLMLSNEEALAVLLGLVAGRRSGLISTSVAAVESAVAKVRRVLPEALGSRLDAVLEADFTAPVREAPTADAEVLLTVAQAARERRPVALAYLAGHGGASERVVHPYGVVAHSGRWYVTGLDSASGQVRTFRVDRIADVELRDGTFDVPAGFNPGGHVLASLAEAPHQHEVAVRIRSTPEEIRSVFPPSVAVLEEITADTPWTRVRIRAERLDWIPPLLAVLDRPFVVEQPDDLRDLIRALAGRLAAHADS